MNAIDSPGPRKHIPGEAKTVSADYKMHITSWVADKGGKRVSDMVTWHVNIIVTNGKIDKSQSGAGLGN
jgi:hypothetical protein